MAFSAARAFSARGGAGAGQQQQFAAAAARPSAAARLPARSRRAVRAAIEAPRPSSPQPQRSSEIPNASSTTSASASPSTAAVENVSIAKGESTEKRESVLCTRLAAHSKAVTALLVLNDTDDVKEIVTASLDKTVALWRLVEGTSSEEGGSPCDAPTSTSSADPLCSSAAALVARLGGEDDASTSARGAPVFALAADVDGAADAARLERILANSSSSTSAGDAAAAAVRRAEAALDCPAAPSASASPSSFSSFSASPSLLLPRLPTVFIGGGTPSVRGWQPTTSNGSAAPIPDVVLEGHSGWVRSLAASGRWLFSCGCGGIKQWDLSRAVPRCVATVSLPRGDVSSLAATPTALFAGGADGSLCVWKLPTSRKNEGGVGALKKDAPPDAVVAGAHSARVSALAVVVGRNQVVSASHDGSLALWSLCAGNEGGLFEEAAAEECCVTHAEEEATAAAAAAAAAEAEKKEKAASTTKPAAKLVLVSRVKEAHGVSASDEPVAAVAVAVAPASDASIPVPAAPAVAAANKIHAAVVGRDGLLYTGGDDGLVARWVISSSPAAASSSSSSSPKGDGEGQGAPSASPSLVPSPSGPLHGHGGSPVRALAAGPGDALVSGDAAGNVLLWRL